LTLACALAISVLSHGPAYAQSAEGRTDWPGPGQLYVGTCYQPVDRSPEQITGDIALMKQAGFKVVRMGDLAWDAFEPAEGKFDFKLFDWIMDQMRRDGLQNVRGEPVMVPHWVRGAESAELVAPRRAPLVMLGLGHSIGTPPASRSSSTSPVNRRRRGCTTSTRAPTSSPSRAPACMRPNATWTTSATRTTGDWSRASPTR